MAKFEDYTWLSSLAKSFKGPKGLVGSLIAGGALFGAGFTELRHWIFGKHADDGLDTSVYAFTKDSKSENIPITKGTKFKVLESKDTPILLQIVGDDEPHYIERDRLLSDSNWK